MSKVPLKVPLVPRTPVFQNGGQVSGLKPFLDFICKLEGWKTKCKNLHWAAPKKNVHVYLDEFLEVISDYQDTVAEGIMGVLSVHLGPSDVKGDPGNAQNAQQFVDEVKAGTLSFYKQIPENPLYAGLKSECETFIQNVNKFDYLFSLTDSKL